MDSFIARANIDHYLSILNGSGLTPQNRSTINKLLVAEEDKLGHDLESLEFAEARAARSRERMNHFRRLRDSFVEGSSDRAHADGVLANFETIYNIMEQACQRLGERIKSRNLERWHADASAPNRKHRGLREAHG